MKLFYNVKGQNRKELVASVSKIQKSSIKYLGAPTFSYEIGDYTIDRNGTLTGKDNLDLEDALHQQGFDATKCEYEEPDVCENKAGDLNDINEIDQWAERQIYRMKIEDENVPDYSNRGPYGGDYIPESPLYRAELCDPDYPDRMEVFSATDDEDALKIAREFCTDDIVLLELFLLDDDYNEVICVEITPSRLTLQMPITEFTPEKLNNLYRLISSKDSLLKAALDTDDLSIHKTTETLDFPWFQFTDDADTVNAYSMLVSLLCKTAIQRKRITAKEHIVENPKYTMRCFLLSLGFIGDEYKRARKILLSKLQGNSSRKTAKDKEN